MAIQESNNDDFEVKRGIKVIQALTCGLSFASQH